jgi:hypothetical protein
MDERAARAIVEARRLRRSWGPRKLVAWLAARDPSLLPPAPAAAPAARALCSRARVWSSLAAAGSADAPSTPGNG